MLLAAGELSLRGLKVGQALLPLALQPARDEPVVGVDRPIAALRAGRLVSGPLSAEPPLLERRLGIEFKALGRGEGGGELDRLERGQERPGDRLVDLHPADVEAIATVALDTRLARAMVAGGDVTSAVVRLQAPAAVAAGQSGE